MNSVGCGPRWRATQSVASCARIEAYGEPLSLDYAEPLMDRCRRLDDAGGLKLDVFAAEELEHPGAAASTGADDHGPQRLTS